MIEGRTALYRGFMIIIHPYPKRGMTAYRSKEFYLRNITSYVAQPGIDITDMMDDANDYGEFTTEHFSELVGSTDLLPIVDICVGCGQEFLAQELLYEGVEPIVFDPRCRICMIKQAQDTFGAENVILPESYRN